jgi:ketosteroid isomerase-like protein
MAAIPVSRDDAAEQMRAMDAEFARNANSGNANALVEAFYANDAQLLPPNSPKVSGKPAITQFWQGFMAAGASDVQLETADISASGDLAYGVGAYKFKMAGAPQEGKYVVVYRRQQNGRYRAVVDMFSSNA